MKQVVFAVLLMAALGTMTNPWPADAQQSRLKECLQEAVESCDEDFENNSPEMVAIRGWCYIIRGVWCRLL